MGGICKRCGRVLIDPNKDYGWRCAMKIGVPHGSARWGIASFEILAKFYDELTPEQRVKYEDKINDMLDNLSHQDTIVDGIKELLNLVDELSDTVGKGKIYKKLLKLGNSYVKAESQAERNKYLAQSKLLLGLARTYIGRGNKDYNKFLKAFDMITKYENRINAVAKSLKIDPYLIATTIFREVAMTDWKDAKDFPAAYLGFNTVSLGLGQVSPRTARKAYDNYLSYITGRPVDSIKGLSYQELVKKLNDPDENIKFVGLILWDIQNRGKTNDVDIFSEYNGSTVYGEASGQYVPMIKSYFN